jgi:lipid A 3-O-deacylase
VPSCFAGSFARIPSLLITFIHPPHQEMTLRNRIAALLLLCCVLVCCASAQSDDSRPLGRWNYAVFAGGGTGLMDRTDVQFVRAGARIGRVLTRQHKLGSFEVDAEVTPVDYTLWSGYKNVYGFGFNPLILKWDLPTHAGRKVAPFFLAQGGMLFTSANVPPGDTSEINFVSGAGFGMHVFTRPGRAITVDIRATHLSNASLGNHNPGVNSSLQFSLGYTWFKR